jgi:hypothetical protein
MKTQRIPTWLLALAATALIIPPISAQADTRVLPFQGRLSDANGNALPDGSRVVQFKIYDAPVGGRAVWNGEVQNLTVNSGLVSTLLGTKATLAGVDFNQDLYLELTIDANGDGQITLADPPLLPRQSILPAVFARESANTRLLGGYDWGPLFGTNNPADGTLLDSKIGDGSLASSKIRDAAITSAKIADGAVTRSKLDVTGASAGQSLIYNGTNVVWNPVHAVTADNAVNAANAANAAKLNGYDWGAMFPGTGDPANGLLSTALALVRGNLYIGNASSDYRRITMGGGNSYGFLFGSYPAYGDGIHLGYNSYFDEGGVGHISAGDGATSRITVGYGFVGLYVGAVGNYPVIQRLIANATGVRVDGTFNNQSDRNAKQDFSSVNPTEILAKVAVLPISKWSYKEDPTTRHIGPMGQDFYSIFNIGTDEKSIAPMDQGGIALAAIQALNQKVERKEKAIQDLQDRVRQLEQLLAKKITGGR